MAPRLLLSSDLDEDCCEAERGRDTGATAFVDDCAFAHATSVPSSRLVRWVSAGRGFGDLRRMGSAAHLCGSGPRTAKGHPSTARARACCRPAQMPVDRLATDAVEAARLRRVGGRGPGEAAGCRGMRLCSVAGRRAAARSLERGGSLVKISMRSFVRTPSFKVPTWSSRFTWDRQHRPRALA